MVKFLLFLIGIYLPAAETFADLSFSVSDTDLSFNYLRAIYGNIEGVFYADGSQIMGRIFRIFNSLALSIGGMILLYILVVSTINTANSGEVMGKNWSSIWVPIRAVLGLALLLPRPSGYCTIQGILMWLIMQGVGVANSIWHEALDYISTRPLIQQTSHASENALRTAVTRRANTMEALAAFYLKTAVCMKISEKEIATRMADRRSSLLADREIYYADPDNCANCNIDSINQALSRSAVPPNLTRNISFNMPYNPGIPQGTLVKFSNFPNNNSYHGQAFNGSCGTISLADTGSQQGNLLKSAAHAQLFSEMSAIADQYVRSGYAEIVNKDLSIGTAILNFYYAIEAGAGLNNSIANDDKNTIRNAIAEAKREGWLSAGTYYYRMAQIEYNNQSIPESYYAFTTSGGVGIAVPDNVQSIDDNTIPLGLEFVEDKDKVAVVNKVISDNAFQTDSNLSNYIQNYKGKWRDVIPVNINLNDDKGNSKDRFLGIVYGYGAAFVAFLSAAAAVMHVAAGAATAIALSFGLARVGAGFEALFDGLQSPLIALSMIGSGLLDMASSGWLASAIGAFAGSLSGSLLAGWNPAPFAFIVAAAYVAPMLTLIYASMIVSGAVLFIYVPLIPVVVYFFSALGWFFAVLEAIAAAPLVALGIIHPEGHEVFGKSEQAVMLALNIFLRPSLMIIAFIIASMLSYVGAWMLNRAFLVTFLDVLNISNTFGESAAAGTGTGFIFSMPIIVIVYGSICIAMFQSIFELISKLPDELLRWIGSAMTSYSSSAAQKSQALQSTVSSAGNQVGQAAGQGVTGSTQTALKGENSSSGNAGVAKAPGGSLSGSGGGSTVQAGNDAKPSTGGSGGGSPGKKT